MNRRSFLPFLGLLPFVPKLLIPRQTVAEQMADLIERLPPFYGGIATMKPVIVKHPYFSFNISESDLHLIPYLPLRRDR